VQTGTGLRRSHLRKARNLARTTLLLTPTVVTPTPPARQTQAEASDALKASTAITPASVARLVLISPSLASTSSKHEKAYA